MDAKTRRAVKQMITEAVHEALTVEWRIEQHRDPATGQPLALPRNVTEKIFLPSAIMQMLPYHEGALRGLQADIGKHTASSTELRRLVEVIEAAGPVLLRLSEALQRMPKPPEVADE